MDINYGEIAERAVAYAENSNIVLDYSKESIKEVDSILGQYYEHAAEYDGEEGAKTLWNIAVHFGIYLGETMLRLKLGDMGYGWYEDDGLPVLVNGDNTRISPISKAHKRILNGPEDSVASFCDVAFTIAEGGFPTKNVHRAVNVELASGECIKDVPYRNIGSYIMRIEDGEEDFMILNSQDGFLQFYGVKNRFVAELRVNLPDGDFRTYSLIDKEKEHLTERIQFTTPYGRSTPAKREVVSLEQIKAAVRSYYERINTKDFLEAVPCINTTEETKRCMGIIK